MRRKAKASAKAAVTDPSSPVDRGPGPVEADPTLVEQPAEQADATEPVAAPPPPPPPVAGGPHPDYSTTGDGGDPREFSANHYLDLGDLFTSPRNPSEDERLRMAAAEWQAAIAPAFAGMEGAPPAATTPDEAVREFVEKTGPALPDPGAGTDGNIFNNEATAYMRIRKQFSKRIGRSGGPWSAPPGLMPGAPADGGQHRTFHPSGS
ncbi:MAG: hypothetical protein M3Z84_00875 [Actinomycetota bacterium]|nr:hypothetical protein [Actinomycetota bacterium]